MPSEEDLQLGRILAAAGLVPEARLQEVFAKLGTGPEARSLGEFLSESGVITADQWRAALVLQGRRPSVRDAEPAPPPEAAAAPSPPTTRRRMTLFGRLILERGWATQTQIEECLHLQEELDARGKPRQLGEILVDKGYLTVPQVQDLLAFQNKVITVCVGCRSRFNVQGYRKGQALKCPKCGDLLAVPESVAGAGVEATVNHDGTPADPMVGRTLGGCKVLQRIGSGGMATVYKVRHLVLNKLMALKVLSMDTSKDQDMIERFLREAQSSARLEHPNIVQVYNAGREGGVNFILMQYIEGQSLNELLFERKRLTVDEAVKIVCDAARGLGAAHAKGIIHRDVKPDNIMIGPDQTVRVADFGLARDVRGPGEGTAVVAGTPAYMAPEQWRSEAVDARTDLYALGVTFYYLVTGKRPFEATAVHALMQMHLAERVKAPHAIEHDIPAAVSAIIGKMMAKKPEKRYASTADLLKDMERYRGGLDPIAMADGAKMKECPFCQTMNPVTTRKCSVCGEYLQALKDQDLSAGLELEFNCPSCGSQIEKGASNCPSCEVDFCTNCEVRVASVGEYCRRCASSAR